MRAVVIGLFLSVAAVGWAGASPQSGSPAAELDDLFSGGRASGAELDRRIADASSHPLGSRENPVRVNMPEGQRGYLARLRCADGRAPEFMRVGSYGAGPFGSIIDGYDVRCVDAEPARSMIFMDMYHPNHDERAPPPGFTLSAGPYEQAI